MKNEIKDRIFSIPNILSLIRILLVPVFIVLILNKKIFEGLLVFLIASATDALDGFIARSFHQKTRLGQFLDPAADKLLMNASYIILSISSLSYPNVIPIWLTGCVFGRDILIVSVSFYLYRITNKKYVSVTIPGKLTTICQTAVLLLVLFFNWKEITPSILMWFYYLTLILTIFSGINYAVKGFQLYKRRTR
ncbi:MAG: CDP-diacylglycerol--glycerol-3-phosphate 3-phosphatidyltransferase [Candidatus Aminicenantes bacterium]|nr:CDP-diacylglycerol--glycerol-3-phosphate 3-phosphatidyltransferase [Candidatus Aminicenantes bacterium]